ncbi:hypothetical protein [Streptosporangium sp. H16]|uniref:hypothetical protein n=1 Tax=Streptosporangium sp. H16 TaxID=3444184 RepID=UPI003F798622
MSKTSTPDHASPVGLDTHGHHRPGGRPGPRYPFQGWIGTPAFRENTGFTVIARPSGETDAWRIPVEPLHADWDQPYRRAAV